MVRGRDIDVKIGTDVIIDVEEDIEEDFDIDDIVSVHAFIVPNTLNKLTNTTREDICMHVCM